MVGTFKDKCTLFGEVDALAGKLVAILKKVFKLIVSLKQVVEEKVLILNYLSKIIKPVTFNVKLFYIILNKVFDFMAFYPYVPFKFLDSFLQQR